MPIVFLKTFAWIFFVTLTINLAAAYTLWRLLNISYSAKLIICLIMLAGLFLPEIIFPMTLQIVIPKLHSGIGLFVSYFVYGYPFLLIPALLLSTQFQSTDYLSSLNLLPSHKRFFDVFFLRFLKVMAPFSLILFLILFHNFSLPALWEIELLPNYLFAEFNTYYSFSPFFKKTIPSVFILIAFSLAYLRFFPLGVSNKHFSFEKYEFAEKKYILGILIFILWFILCEIFPLVYWGYYLINHLNEVDWKKVSDCGVFSLEIAVIVSAVSLFFGILTVMFKKINIVFPAVAFLIVYSFGNVAVAVASIYFTGMFSKAGASIFPMILSLCIMNVPLTLLLLLYLKSRVNRNIFLTSELYISSKWKKFRFISFPVLFPGIFSVMLIILNFTIKDLDTSILTVPPGKSFLPVRLHLLLHYADYPSLSAIVLIYIFVIIISMTLIYLLARRLLNYGLINH